MFWLGMIIGGIATLFALVGIIWLLDTIQERADDREYETDLQYRTAKWELDQQRSNQE